jgi:hypothetical protein
MSSLIEAIELNNAARLSFSDGDVVASLVMIQRAVTLVRSLHTSLEESEDTAEDPSCLDEGIFSFATKAHPGISRLLHI